MAGPYAQPDNEVPAEMFINKAAQSVDPTDDEGRVPILEVTGQLHPDFVPTLALEVQEFTANGTWTKPSKGTYALIEILGAAGSGGVTKQATNNIAQAAGGSGGAFRQFLMKLSDLNPTETVTVGVGGAAVSTSTGSTAVAGLAGGVSWFKNVIMQALGGLGGPASTGTATVSAAGAASAAILIAEKGGNSGSATSSSPFANPGESTIYSGPGGGSAFSRDSGTLVGASLGGLSMGVCSGNGGDAVAVTGTADLVGNDGGRGAGGGAACKRNATGTVTSGKGGNGFVRVTVF